MEEESLFETYLREEKGASQNTISSYLRDVHQFVVWLEAERLPVAKVKTEIGRAHV